MKQLDGMVSARGVVRIERALQFEMTASFLATTVTNYCRARDVATCDSSARATESQPSETLMPNELPESMLLWRLPRAKDQRLKKTFLIPEHTESECVCVF